MQPTAPHLSAPPAPNAPTPSAGARVPAALLALAAACAAPAPPERELIAPAFLRTSELIPAVGLDGAPRPGAEPVATEAEGGLIVAVRAFWLAKPFAEERLSALASEVDLVADLSGNETTLATPELTASALVARGEAARGWVSALLASDAAREVVFDETRSLPLGDDATWKVELLVHELAEDPRDWLDEFPDRGPIPRSMALHLTPRTADSLGVTFSITDLDPERERALVRDVVENPEVLPGPPPPRHKEDLRVEALRTVIDVAADGPSEGAISFVLHARTPFRTGRGEVLVFAVAASRATAGSEALSVGRTEIAEHRTARDAAAEPLTDAGEDDLVRAEALRAFQSRGGRAALLSLARESGAEVAGDLALVATEDDLAVVAETAFPPATAERIEARENDPPPPAPYGVAVDPRSIAWRLEAAAWKLLAKRALEETLSPALSGVLVQHAGAAARFPDVILEAVDAAGGSLTALRERIAAENLLALEDSAASARVRAHDWLVARGRGVTDFQPLAPRDERRAALAAASATGDANGADNGASQR